MAIPKILDILVLKNGDFINGTVLTKTLSIKTVFGTIRVRLRDVAHIHMKGQQFPKDEILTLEMNRFTGTIQEKTVEVKLQSGESIEINKTKIHTVIALTNRTSP